MDFLCWRLCCGSGMSRIRIRFKDFYIFNPKNWYEVLKIKILDVRPGFWILYLFPSRIQGSKRHRIPDAISNTSGRERIRKWRKKCLVYWPKEINLTISILTKFQVQEFLFWVTCKLELPIFTPTVKYLLKNMWSPPPITNYRKIMYWFNYLIALLWQQNSSFTIFYTNAELSKCVGEAKALLVSVYGISPIYDINSIYSFVHSCQYSMCVSLLPQRTWRLVSTFLYKNPRKYSYVFYTFHISLQH